jgi:hypothetical protein
MRRAVYITALYTGLRRAELEALEYGDYNLTAPVPYVHARASPTKNGKDAFIPLHPAAVDAFLDISPNNPSPAETVFTVPSIETFKTDLEAAGIPYKDERGHKTDFHALRTTYCTLMVSTGVAPRVAQELMRHSDIKLTMKNYTDTNLLPTASAIHGLKNFAIPVATPNPTLAGIGCPAQSEKIEGQTFKAPNNKGLGEVASPLVSQGEMWCRRRDSNPHDITRQILSLLRLPISPLRHSFFPHSIPRRIFLPPADPPRRRVCCVYQFRHSGFVRRVEDRKSLSLLQAEASSFVHQGLLRGHFVIETDEFIFLVALAQCHS